MPVTKVFTPADIWQGPADVYLDVAAPTSAIPPVAGTNTLTLDVSGQPTDTGAAGVHLGITEGPVMVDFQPGFHDILGDQLGAQVDAALVSLKGNIDFALKEMNFVNLVKYFGSSLGTYTSLSAGSTNPAADFIQIGAPRSSQTTKHTLLLVSPRRDAAQKYGYVLAYRAILASAIASELSRAKENIWKLKFECLADTTRVASDQVAQIVKGL